VACGFLGVGRLDFGWAVVCHIWLTLSFMAVEYIQWIDVFHYWVLTPQLHSFSTAINCYNARLFVIGILSF
jgi:hypothetical protein